MNRRLPLMLILFPGAILLLTVLGVAALAWLQHFLRGERFLQLVSTETSRALHVQGSFEPLSWSGFEVYSPGFHGKGNPDSPLAAIELQQIRTRIVWREIFAGLWKLDGISIGTAEILLRNRAHADGDSLRAGDLPASASPAVAATGTRSAAPGWLPRRFDPGEVVVGTATMRFGEGAVRRTQLNLRAIGQTWELRANGGSFEWPGMPENSLREAVANLSKEGFFLTNANFTLNSGGQLRVSGEQPSGARNGTWRLRWEAVPVTQIFNRGTSFRINGECAGEAVLTIPANGGMSANGSFTVRDGRLENLPLLAALARFTGAGRFDPLPVTQISGSFQTTPAGTQIREFVLESAGLLRIEGELHIGAGGTLDGALSLGLTSATLRWIPGSREKVFLESRDGYVWAPVQVTGTTEAPSEDLSARLLQALGQQVLEEGSRVLERAAEGAKQGVQGILDLFRPRTE